MTEDKICILYRSIIRPLLEYGAPVWSPWHKTDIESLEKVQRRCLKLASPHLVLETLESRRLQSDLNETYKFTHGSYKSDSANFFSNPTRKLRGHSLKLHKQFAITDIRKHFYFLKVVA